MDPATRKELTKLVIPSSIKAVDQRQAKWYQKKRQMYSGRASLIQLSPSSTFSFLFFIFQYLALCVFLIDCSETWPISSFDIFLLMIGLTCLVDEMEFTLIGSRYFLLLSFQVATVSAECQALSGSKQTSNGIKGIKEMLVVECSIMPD